MARQSHSHLLLLFFTILFPFSLAQETVGFGYVIQPIIFLANNSLQANLSLINSSSVFGADVQSLSLLVR